jgi:hypothetical protein
MTSKRKLRRRIRHLRRDLDALWVEYHHRGDPDYQVQALATRQHIPEALLRLAAALPPHTEETR